MMTSGKVFWFGWDREELGDSACGDLAAGREIFCPIGLGLASGSIEHRAVARSARTEVPASRAQ